MRDTLPARLELGRVTSGPFASDPSWGAYGCFYVYETVIQFHPPKSEYINNHEFCLHLWKHKTQAFPLPPSELVGVKDPRNMTSKERQAVAEWRVRHD